MLAIEDDVSSHTKLIGAAIEDIIEMRIDE